MGTDSSVIKEQRLVRMMPYFPSRRESQAWNVSRDHYCDGKWIAWFLKWFSELSFFKNVEDFLMMEKYPTSVFRVKLPWKDWHPPPTMFCKMWNPTKPMRPGTVGIRTRTRSAVLPGIFRAPVCTGQASSTSEHAALLTSCASSLNTSSGHYCVYRVSWGFPK